MSQLAIIAFPQAAAKIMLIDDDLKENGASWMCWGHELITEVPRIVQEVDGEITSIIIFGPDNYVTVIAEGLQNILPNIQIQVGDM